MHFLYRSPKPRLKTGYSNITNMKLWLTDKERELVALKRKSVLEQERINEGKNYADYIKEEIKAERMSKEEGEWNVLVNRRSNLNLTTKGL